MGRSHRLARDDNGYSDDVVLLSALIAVAVALACILVFVQGAKEKSRASAPTGVRGAHYAHNFPASANLIDAYLRIMRHA
jgi:hypothetical protein